MYVDPDAETLARLRRSTTRPARGPPGRSTRARSPAVTADGVEVAVGANLGSVDDARAAAHHGADLAGLVRTEFLYLDRREAPTVEEQVEVYRRSPTRSAGARSPCAPSTSAATSRSRTLPQPPEANPFLGVRGIRLALAERQLLDDQLRAVVAVAHETPVDLMFPMVSTVDELVEARARLDEAIAASGRGRPDAPPGRHHGRGAGHGPQGGGVRRRTSTSSASAPTTSPSTRWPPSAATPSVAALADPLDPGVLRLIDAVCRAADGRCLVAVCGELAADERAVPLLVGLGVRELSVAPSSVPGVKEAVRRIATAADADLVARCLSAADPEQVRSLLGKGVR